MYSRVLLFILFPSFFGCSVLTAFPDSRDQKQRLKALKSAFAPVSESTKIYWEEHSIPFVEAQSDEDLAFAVGVVHAHLRLGQLEVFRHISQGRLSEVAGPIGLVQKIDHFLQVIDFKKAAKASLPELSPESRMWLRRFTEGINWYLKEKLVDAPVEFQLIGKPPKPYTELEVLTLGKLIGADLTWAFYLKFLKLREQSGWSKLLAEDQKSLEFAEPTAETEQDVDRVIGLIKSFSKSGSNSVVISGERTQSGSSMIASDPHVGLFLPNFWLLMGIKSPSTHAIGYMIPGIPIIGVGRNEHIAWGGTNMRGISSHLYRIPEDMYLKSKKEERKLKRRWWTSATIELSQTSKGAIFNDNPYFDLEKQKDKFALYWVGHEGSDEVDAFLRVQKSKSWEEFRGAFENYRISAMNILYADQKGNIGMVPAYGQPILKDTSKTLDLYKELDNPVLKILKPNEQSNPYNPKSGFIASANNKPFSETAAPYSYSFANNDRFNRMKSLLEGTDKVSLEDLKKLQLDVINQKSLSFAKQLTRLENLKVSPFLEPLYRAIRDWDGKYDSDSSGAAAQEIVKYFAWQDYIEQLDLSQAEKDFRLASGDKLSYLNPWLSTLSENILEKKLVSWLSSAQPHFKRNSTWGSLHRQPQQSFFGMLPLIGSRFALDDYPASGGDDTLNKSGRVFSPSRESVTYGASARHLSDLSDRDENYFVMHGGNDGWLMNDQLSDQVPLWRKGQYIRLPLSIDKVKKVFKSHLTELKPKSVPSY